MTQNFVPHNLLAAFDQVGCLQIRERLALDNPVFNDLAILLYEAVGIVVVHLTNGLIKPILSTDTTMIRSIADDDPGKLVGDISRESLPGWIDGACDILGTLPVDLVSASCR